MGQLLGSAFLSPSLKPHDSNRRGMIIPTASGSKQRQRGKVLEPRPWMVMLVYLRAFWITPTYRRASQVAPVAKNPPANAGDRTDVSSIPGSGRSPGVGNGAGSTELQDLDKKFPTGRVALGVWLGCCRVGHRVDI